MSAKSIWMRPDQRAVVTITGDGGPFPSREVKYRVWEAMGGHRSAGSWMDAGDRVTFTTRYFQSAYCVKHAAFGLGWRAEITYIRVKKR